MCPHRDRLKRTDRPQEKGGAAVDPVEVADQGEMVDQVAVGGQMEVVDQGVDVDHKEAEDPEAEGDRMEETVARGEVRQEDAPCAKKT